MKVHEVVGTQFFVVRKGWRKWYVIAPDDRYGPEIYKAMPKAGPFQTKADAINWAILNEVFP